MKASHYLAIGIRLFSVALCLYTLQQSSILIEVLISGGINGVETSILFVLSTTVLPILAAAMLWCFPLTLSRSILKPEVDQPVECLSAQSVLTVLILAIGLYTMFYAVIDSIYWTTLWHMSSESQHSSAPIQLSEESKANMLATAIELTASIAILLKARSLSCRLLHFSN